MENVNSFSDLATFNRRHFRKHYFFEKLSVHGVKQIQILSTTSSRQHQNILDSTKNIFEILSAHRSEVRVYRCSFGIVLFECFVPGWNYGIGLVIHDMLATLVLQSNGRLKAGSVVLLSTLGFRSTLSLDSHSHAVHHGGSLALNSRLVSPGGSHRVSETSLEVINVDLARSGVLNHSDQSGLQVYYLTNYKFQILVWLKYLIYLEYHDELVHHKEMRNLVLCQLL